MKTALLLVGLVLAACPSAKSQNKSVQVGLDYMRALQSVSWMASEDRRRSLFFEPYIRKPFDNWAIVGGLGYGRRSRDTRRQDGIPEGSTDDTFGWYAKVGAEKRIFDVGYVSLSGIYSDFKQDITIYTEDFVATYPRPVIASKRPRRAGQNYAIELGLGSDYQATKRLMLRVGMVSSFYGYFREAQPTPFVFFPGVGRNYDLGDKPTNYTIRYTVQLFYSLKKAKTIQPVLR